MKKLTLLFLISSMIYLLLSINYLSNEKQDDAGIQDLRVELDKSLNLTVLQKSFECVMSYADAIIIGRVISSQQVNFNKYRYASGSSLSHTGSLIEVERVLYGRGLKKKIVVWQSWDAEGLKLKPGWRILIPLKKSRESNTYTPVLKNEGIYIIKNGIFQINRVTALTKLESFSKYDNKTLKQLLYEIKKLTIFKDQIFKVDLFRNRMLAALPISGGNIYESLYSLCAYMDSIIMGEVIDVHKRDNSTTLTVKIDKTLYGREPGSQFTWYIKGEPRDNVPSIELKKGLTVILALKATDGIYHCDPINQGSFLIMNKLLGDSRVVSLSSSIGFSRYDGVLLSELLADIEKAKNFLGPIKQKHKDLEIYKLKNVLHKEALMWEKQQRKRLWDEFH